MNLQTHKDDNMKKYIYLFFFFLFPNILFGQLYKCDSTSNDSTIIGGFRNGQKHGVWSYYKEDAFDKLKKIEVYWFGELVYEDTTDIQKCRMFNVNDTIVEYSLNPTFYFVLKKNIKIDSNQYYYCELSRDTDGNSEWAFYKINKTQIQNEIDNFCKLTNRFIILEGLRIPVITQFDRDFAHIGWCFTSYDFKILLNPNGLIINVYK